MVSTSTRVKARRMSGHSQASSIRVMKTLYNEIGMYIVPRKRGGLFIAFLCANFSP